MSWQSGDGLRRAGRIELNAHGLELESTSPPEPAEQIRFSDIAAISVANGCLRLGRPERAALRITSLDGPGALRELADRVAASV